MSDPNIHRFTSPIEGIPLPSAFTYPFHYTPHPLVQMAAHEVQVYLRTRSDWEEELSKGKMFGVLLIQDKEGNVGYLTAFSGNLAQNNRQNGFVPPVYDLLRPDGFFKLEESEISDINRRIEALEKVCAKKSGEKESHPKRKPNLSKKASSKKPNTNVWRKG